MLALATAQLWVLAVAGAALGAAIGSFGCVIIERLPVALDEPNEFGDEYSTRPWGEVVGGDSRCSSCGADIRWVDKIPVLSWFLLRGKCRGCGDRIPGFHPMVELAVPVVGVALVAAMGVEWRTAPALWLVPVGIVLAVIDLRTYILPTKIVWPAFFVTVALALVAAGIEGEWAWLWGAFLGLVMLAGPLAVLWFAMPNGMGFGDVRLSVMLGWILGFTVYESNWTIVAFFVALLFALSAVIGIVMGIGGMIAIGRKAKVPFGPALVLGSFVLLAFHAELIEGFALLP